MGLTDRISDIEVSSILPRDQTGSARQTIRNDEFTVDWYVQLRPRPSIWYCSSSRTGLDLDLANGFMQARRRMVFTAEAQPGPEAF